MSTHAWLMRKEMSSKCHTCVYVYPREIGWWCTKFNDVNGSKWFNQNQKDCLQKKKQQENGREREKWVLIISPNIHITKKMNYGKLFLFLLPLRLFCHAARPTSYLIHRILPSLSLSDPSENLHTTKVCCRIPVQSNTVIFFFHPFLFILF